MRSSPSFHSGTSSLTPIRPSSPPPGSWARRPASKNSCARRCGARRLVLFQKLVVGADVRVELLEDQMDDVAGHQHVSDAWQPRDDVVEAPPPTFLVEPRQAAGHLVRF